MGTGQRAGFVIDDPDAFPRLTQRNHRLTSPADVSYNCIAWALGDVTRWWQPGFYWPIAVSRDVCGIGTLVEMFRTLGFHEGASQQLETGIEKVALYGNGLHYTHAARQLPTGKWTSKLGKLADIEHDHPDDVAGGIYGEVVEVMMRTHDDHGMVS
jgi:hypothetical protein